MIMTIKNLYPIIALLLFGHWVQAQELKYTVHFDFNKSNIPDSAMVDMVQIMHKHLVEKIVIEGHCDSIGSKEYNYTLSEKRANEVKKLLIQNGIEKKAVQTCIGYGKDKPLSKNDSEQDRQQNRRVNIHFFIAKRKDEKVAKTNEVLKSSDFEVGKKIVLKNLHFYGGQHVLQPESKPVLDNLCKILRENPNLKIEIQGHVCCTTFQADGYDIDTKTDNLSVTRAELVYLFLTSKCGISKKRLSYTGFGGTQKIIENDITEEQQRMNRRVEIKVIEN